MITTTEGLKLRAIIGNVFTKNIQKILEENNQRVYSDRYISHVLNGRYENLEIEKAFYILSENISEEKKLLKKSKRKLEKNKPEADTSGS